MTLSGLGTKGTMDVTMVVYRSGSKGDYGCIQVWVQRGLWVYTGLDPKETMGIYRSGPKGDYGYIQVWT